MVTYVYSLRSYNISYNENHGNCFAIIGKPIVFLFLVRTEILP
nr:MAG TPA: hypothetical protein [Caudoviricetes sp.]